MSKFNTNRYFQILPISEDPGKVLRTTTKGIGTNSYRAPEVESYRGYDPSAADIWSLGITLFFMVCHSWNRFSYIHVWNLQMCNTLLYIYMHDTQGHLHPLASCIDLCIYYQITISGCYSDVCTAAWSFWWYSYSGIGTSAPGAGAPSFSARGLVTPKFSAIPSVRLHSYLLYARSARSIYMPGINVRIKFQVCIVRVHSILRLVPPYSKSYSFATELPRSKKPPTWVINISW